MRIKDLNIEKLKEILNEVKLLREDGCSYNEIRRILKEKYGLEISKATMIRWVKGTHVPFRKIKVLNLEPSKELSYIIGAFLGDGYVKRSEINRGNYVVGLKVKDKEFAEEFARCLEKIGLRAEVRYEKDRTRTDRWCVEVKSKHLFQFLTQPKNVLFKIAERHSEDFLRGFFDAEGDFSSGILYVCNSDKDIIDFVDSLLKKLGMIFKRRFVNLAGKVMLCRGVPYIMNRDIWYLWTTKRVTIMSFYKKIGFTIRRKMKAIEVFLFGRERK